jgi:hypothetical protein
LLIILHETKSPDTFVVTARALAAVGPAARRAVPAVIRGAERLNLLSEIGKQAKAGDGLGMVVVEAIEELLQGQGAGRACCTPVCAPVCAPPVAYAVPCCPPAAGGPPWFPACQPTTFTPAPMPPMPSAPAVPPAPPR